MSAKASFERDEEKKEEIKITGGGVVLVDPTAMARLLKSNGTLDSLKIQIDSYRKTLKKYKKKHKKVLVGVKAVQAGALQKKADKKTA